MSPGRARRFARPVGHGLIFAGLAFAIYLFAFVAPQVQSAGYDAYAYWHVSLPEPYAIPLGQLGSFNYAPPVALVFDWFSVVDWWVFWFLWMTLLVGTIIWIGWSPLWVLAAFAVPFVTLELYHGNIHVLLAAAVVLGFRHPWAWAFVVLTKPTSGVGLLWFAVRREWRSLGIALGATAVVCLVSLILWPSLWADWIGYVLGYWSTTPERAVVPIPLWLRLPAAAILVVWGALTDRRWTVVVSACLALPALWIAGLAMLIGIIPEIRGRRRGLSGPDIASSGRQGLDPRQGGTTPPAH